MTMPFFDDDPDGDRARDQRDEDYEDDYLSPDDQRRLDSDDEAERREISEHGAENFG